MATITELEASIGFPPAFVPPRHAVEVKPITADQRDLIKAWLLARGFTANDVKHMKDETLYKCYASRSYLIGTAAGKSVTLRDSIDSVPAPVPVPDKPLPSPEYVPPVDAPIPAPVPPVPTPSNGADFPALLQQWIESIARGQINEQQVIDLINRHAPKPGEKVVEKIIAIRPSGERWELPNGEFRHEKFAEIMEMVAENIPVCLVGPAGSGKTTMALQIARVFERQFRHTGAIKSEFKLSGYQDAHGVYHRTTYRDSYEYGYHYLFDEIDGSEADALLWCNTSLANGFCSFPDGEIERHPDFRIIACANTYGRGADRLYVGRNEIDASSTDRFVFVDFDYDEKLERAIFGDTDWVQYVQKVRHAVGELSMRHVVSPRASDFGSRLLRRGMERERVKSACLWKGIGADQIAMIEAKAGR